MDIAKIEAAVNDARDRISDKDRCFVCGKYPHNQRLAYLSSDPAVDYCSRCSERFAAEALVALWDSMQSAQIRPTLNAEVIELAAHEDRSKVLLRLECDTQDLKQMPNLIFKNVVLEVKDAK